VGEEAVAEAKRFRRLVWFKVGGELAGVTMATCLSVGGEGGGWSLGLWNGVCGSGGLGVSLASISKKKIIFF
jgi:hypothetical protein